MSWESHILLVPLNLAYPFYQDHLSHPIWNLSCNFFNNINCLLSFLVVLAYHSHPNNPFHLYSLEVQFDQEDLDCLEDPMEKVTVKYQMTYLNLSLQVVHGFQFHLDNQFHPRLISHDK